MPKEVSDKLVDTIIKKNPLYLEDSVAIGKGGPSTQLSYDEGVALLYYLGFLTVMPHAEVKHSFGEVNPEKTYLKFPNQYTEFQYSKYLVTRNYYVHPFISDLCIILVSEIIWRSKQCVRYIRNAKMYLQTSLIS